MNLEKTPFLYLYKIRISANEIFLCQKIKWSENGLCLLNCDFTYNTKAIKSYTPNIKYIVRDDSKERFRDFCEMFGFYVVFGKETSIFSLVETIKYRKVSSNEIIKFFETIFRESPQNWIVPHDYEKIIREI